MAWTLDLLKRLNDHGVRYVLIGGVAGIAHGLTRQTRDIDVCAPLDEENVSRILAAYRDIHPRHRMHPDRPAVSDDPHNLRGFKNLYLLTDLGPIDFLSELEGTGDFDELLRHTVELQLHGVLCRVLDLDTLIQLKRATGRRKDLYDLAELEVIRTRLRDAQGGKAT
jgi:predicted nucleotidyltransferase